MWFAMRSGMRSMQYDCRANRMNRMLDASVPWHPDTRPIVVGNASALFNATNDNVSDLDLCTVRQESGEDATVMYFAWGNQELGPTAMVLAMAIVDNCSQERLLASYFA